jgi:S-layer homology domain
MNPASTGRFSMVGAVCGVMALLVSLGGVAFGGGSDLFSDISASPFRAEINRIGRAGCASGFPDGTFHPRGTVNRQQFAFWSNNCGGRVASDTGTGQLFSEGAVTVTEVELRAGATTSEGSEGGFVHLTGTVTAVVNGADAAFCPCRISARIDDTTDAAFGPSNNETLDSDTDQFGESFTNLAVDAVFPIDPEGQKEFALIAFYGATGQSITVTFNGTLSAIYIPFGADGDRALDLGT